MLGCVLRFNQTQHTVLGEKHLSTREQFQLHTQESFIVEESHLRYVQYLNSVWAWNLMGL